MGNAPLTYMTNSSSKVSHGENWNEEHTPSGNRKNSTFQVQIVLWRIIPELSLPLTGNFFTISNPTSEEIQAVTDRNRLDID